MAADEYILTDRYQTRFWAFCGLGSLYMVCLATLVAVQVVSPDVGLVAIAGGLTTTIAALNKAPRNVAKSLLRDPTKEPPEAFVKAAEKIHRKIQQRKDDLANSRGILPSSSSGELPNK